MASFSLNQLGQEEINDDLFGYDIYGFVQGTNGDDDIIGISNRSGTFASRRLPFVGHNGIFGVNGLAGNDDIRIATFGGATSSGRGVHFAGGAGSDRIYGGNGNDVLYTSGPVASFTISGVRDAANTRNVVSAYGGNDVILTGNGKDTVNGGSGDDHIIVGFGTSFNNLESGGYGDSLVGGADVDKIIAGHGGDIIKGGRDKDYIVGGLGGDVISGDHGNDLIYGDWIEPDRQRQIFFTPTQWDEAYEKYYTRNKDKGGTDRISGGSGDDTIYGGDNNDEILGGSGFDTLRGEDGKDIIDFERKSRRGRDEIYGGEGNDELYAGSFYGSVADIDTLFGGGGNDTLYAEGYITDPGLADTRPLTAHRLSGGSGADTFIFESFRGQLVPIPIYGQQQSSVITDFNPAEDKIVLTAGERRDYRFERAGRNTEIWYTGDFGIGQGVFDQEFPARFPVGDQLVVTVQNTDRFNSRASFIEYEG